MTNALLFRVLMLCAVSPTLVGAQMPAPTPRPTTETRHETPARQKSSSPSNKKSAETEDVPGLARRMNAVSLLTNLAEDARNFRDPSLRVRVQARVADALWKADETRARQLFRRAWEELETFEKGGARKPDGATLKGTEGKNQAFISAANLRGELLRLASLRDRKLAEEFLEKLNDQAESDATNAATTSATSPLEMSDSETSRMELAQQLLGGGYAERAQELAGPVLNRVTEQTVRFLSTLRLRNPEAADNQFASLLTRVSADPSADAITISFLSSYVFSPLFFVSVTREGFTNSSRYGTPLPAPELSPALRAAFFRTAAQILLRQLPPEELDRTAAGRPGTYFTILRLLPLFERFAPDYVPRLRVQLSSLSVPVYSEVFNPNTNQHLTEGLTANKKVPDDVPEQLDLSKAKNASERDSIYVNAALNAAAKGDERARDYADKIDDTDLRQQARAYTDFLLLTAALEAEQPEKALRLARSDYLSTFQRAWALTQVARLFKKKEPARAVELLTEPRRSPPHNDTPPTRIRALTAIASQMYDIDLQRTWEIANEVVRAANSSKTFSGEDSRMGVRLKVKESLTEKSFSAPDINLSALFGRLAKDDMYVAVSTAQNLAAEGPRAAALISIARAVLEEHPPSQENRGNSNRKPNSSKL